MSVGVSQGPGPEPSGDKLHTWKKVTVSLFDILTHLIHLIKYIFSNVNIPKKKEWMNEIHY